MLVIVAADLFNTYWAEPFALDTVRVVHPVKFAVENAILKLSRAPSPLGESSLQYTLSINVLVPDIVRLPILPKAAAALCAFVFEYPT